MTPQELRNSILKRAVTGKLVEHSYSKLEVKAIDTNENPFEIPDHWVWQVFGKICYMYTGNSIPVHVKKQKYEGLKEGYDYIGTKDVGFDQTIDYNNGVRIPFETDFKIAKSGSILMCIEGGSAGRKVGVLDRDVCFGNKLCYFNSKVVLNKYIFYYLQSPLFIKEFSSNMTGIISGVSIRKLKNIYLPIPPSEEQKRIVEKIEELMPLIDDYEKNWQRIEELNKKFPEDMKKSLLQEAIKGKLVEQRAEEGTGEELYKIIQEEKKKLIKEGKIKKQKALEEIKEEEIPFDIPKNWKWVRLGEVIELISGQDFPPLKYSEKEKGTPYITGASNIQGEKVIINRWTEFANKIVNKGDLLITCKGTIGKIAVLEVDKAHIARQIMGVKPYSGIDKGYIKFYLSSLSNSLINSAKSIIPGITRNDILFSVIPLPPLAEQKRIVEKLEELLPLCDELRNEEK